MFNYEVIADFSVLILVQKKDFFTFKSKKESMIQGVPTSFEQKLNGGQKKSWKFVYISLFNLTTFYDKKKLKKIDFIIFEIFSKNLLEHPVGIHFIWIWKTREIVRLRNVGILSIRWRVVVQNSRWNVVYSTENPDLAILRLIW